MKIDEELIEEWEDDEVIEIPPPKAPDGVKTGKKPKDDSQDDNDDREDPDFDPQKHQSESEQDSDDGGSTAPQPLKGPQLLPYDLLRDFNRICEAQNVVKSTSKDLKLDLSCDMLSFAGNFFKTPPTTILGMVVQMAVLDGKKAQLKQIFTSAVPDLVQTLVSNSTVDGVIVGTETGNMRTSTICLVSREFFVQTLRSNWSEARIDESPDRVCHIISSQHSGAILKVKIIKSEYASFLKNQKFDPASAHALSKVVGLQILGGLILFEHEMPISVRNLGLRGQEGGLEDDSDEDEAKAGGKKNKAGGKAKKGRGSRNTVAPQSTAASKARITMLKRDPFGKLPKKARSRRVSDQPSAAKGGRKRASGQPAAAEGGRDAPDVGPSEAVNVAFIRKNIGNKNIARDVFGLEALMGIISSPDFQRKHCKLDAGEPRNSAEVENKVFAFAVMQRIDQFLNDEEFTDLNADMQAMRATLLQDLTDLEPVGRSDRHWTTQYTTEHPVPYRAGELRVLFNKAQDVVTELFSAMHAAAQVKSKPSLTADELVDLVIETADAPRSADAPQGRPEAPYAVALHLAMQILRDLWAAYQMAHQKSPSTDVVRAYLALKACPQTAVFATPYVMLAWRTKAGAQDRLTALTKKAAYFLSDECELLEHRVKSAKPSLTIATWE